MSFAKEVKEEISKIKADNCCRLAEIAALLDLGSEVYLSSDGMHLEFQTTNLSVARRFVELLKGLYKVTLEIISKKRECLDKTKMYIVKVIEGASTVIYENDLLEYSKESHIDLICKDCCKKAYLRGAFLVVGSINNPIGSYHLELSSSGTDEVIYIQRLMNDFNLNAKITKRRNKYICYLKEAEKIADFLNLIGATRNYFSFEDVRIRRDFNNSINRVINCEVANMQKTIQSARHQMKDISIIEQYIPHEKIDNKSKEVIILRKKYPDLSLNELVDKANLEMGFKITKSGINHRFRKLHEWALEIIDSLKE